MAAVSMIAACCCCRSTAGHVLDLCWKATLLLLLWQGGEEGAAGAEVPAEGDHGGWLGGQAVNGPQQPAAAAAEMKDLGCWLMPWSVLCALSVCVCAGGSVRAGAAQGLREPQEGRAEAAGTSTPPPTPTVLPACLPGSLPHSHTSAPGLRPYLPWLSSSCGGCMQAAARHRNEKLLKEAKMAK